jgi:hypothetical protein
MLWAIVWVSVVPHQLFEALMSFGVFTSLMLYWLLFSMLFPLIIGEAALFTVIAIGQFAIVLFSTVAFPIWSPMLALVIRLPVIVVDTALFAIMPKMTLFEITTCPDPSPMFMPPILFPVIKALKLLLAYPFPFALKTMAPLIVLFVRVGEH